MFQLFWHLFVHTKDCVTDSNVDAAFFFLCVYWKNLAYYNQNLIKYFTQSFLVTEAL